MSIKIDKKKLYVALLKDFARSLPLSTPIVASWDNQESSWDGEELHLKTTATGKYPAYKTGHSLKAELGAAAYTALTANATVRGDPDVDWYPFFYEPMKGNYDNFQGSHVDEAGNHTCESRDGGVETEVTLTDQDWSVYHNFEIRHYTDQSKCEFYIDGSLVATNTTNIHAQPFEICACEPGGSIMDCYMKYPPGIALGRYYPS